MNLDAESALEYGGIVLATVGVILALASISNETVRIGDLTVGLLLAGDAFVVAGLAVMTVWSRFFDGGQWWYLPLFVVMSGQFLLTLTGPTASNPLETVGFAIVLAGCAGMLYRAWQHDRTAASEA